MDISAERSAPPISTAYFFDIVEAGETSISLDHFSHD
jgi:hypothetical protein